MRASLRRWRLTFIIAEAGINHCGDLSRAAEMVAVAAKSGADAVKFQYFDPARLAPEPSERRALLDRVHLNLQELAILSEAAADHDIEFMCTPFHADYVEPLVDLGVERIKIGSGQAGDAKIVKAAGAARLPVIISVGMASRNALTSSMRILRGCPRTSILYCVSKYPTPDSEVDLNMIDYYCRLYGRGAGYSDHTQTIAWCVAAAAVGADIVEKHFTLDRSLPGPDQICSALPDELANMVEQIRTVRRD